LHPYKHTNAAWIKGGGPQYDESMMPDPRLVGKKNPRWQRRGFFTLRQHTRFAGLCANGKRLILSSRNASYQAALWQMWPWQKALFQDAV